MHKVALFFDIDDCLIHTSALGNKHLQAVTTSLAKLGVDRPLEISHQFATLFHILYDEHQGKHLTSDQKKLFDTLKKRVGELEKPVLEQFAELKRWSREVMILIAAEQVGANINGSQSVIAAIDLWDEITRQADLYPDALPFLHKAIAEKIPIYLITSSDSRLTYNRETKLFEYDPEYSKSLKLKRLQKFIQMGIPIEHIFVGDPIDKPNPHIFREALQFAMQRSRHPRGSRMDSPGVEEISNKQSKQFISVMVGDSVKNDLLPAREAGFDRLIFLNRTGQKYQIPEFIEEITSLSQLV